MSRRVPRFPYDSPPRNAFALWSPVVKCVFFACLLLFSRAFLLDSHGHLAFPMNNSGTGMSNAVPSELYEDGMLPLSWNPILAINLTDKLVSNTYAPNPYRHTSGSDSAAVDNEANGAQPTESSTGLFGKNSNSLETNNSLPDTFSSAIHDLAATQLEKPRNMNSHHDDHYTADNDIGSMLSTQAANAYSFSPKGSDALFPGESLAKLEDEPFLSLEEFDGEGEIFALKIWVSKKEHLRAKLGEVEHCQASSGVKCLSDN